MILEINDYGAYLSKDHESFVIKTHEGKTEIPAVKVDSISISSPALISTSAIGLCLEHGIELVISDIYNNPLGRFWFSSAGKNSELRRRQYLIKDAPQGLSLAKWVVLEKLKRQRKLLEYLRNNRNRPHPKLNVAISYLKKATTKIGTAKKKGELLGIEGNSANYYFRAISSILPPKYQFNERSQHYGKDEFNALLNYAYGVGYRETERIIILRGLDPNAGFYHQDQYGKPTLTYDLIEFVRPRFDRLVISLFTKKEVKKGGFKLSEKGHVILDKRTRLLLLNKYSKIRGDVQSDLWGACKHLTKELMENGI